MKKSSQDDNKQRNPTVRKILSDVAGVSINWKERESVYIIVPKSGNAHTVHRNTIVVIL